MSDYAKFSLVDRYRLPSGWTGNCTNTACRRTVTTDGTEELLPHPLGVFGFDKVEFFLRCPGCTAITAVEIPKDALWDRKIVV